MDITDLTPEIVKDARDKSFDSEFLEWLKAPTGDYSPRNMSEEDLLLENVMDTNDFIMLADFAHEHPDDVEVLLKRVAKRFFMMGWHARH